MKSKAQRIYLDHNALSPIRPEVKDFMLRYLNDPLFNPSSVHESGRKTRMLLDNAREEVAKLLGAQPSEIIFTSGATESIHLAWNVFSKFQCRIATSTVEHAAVLSAANHAERQGADVLKIDVLEAGELDEKDLEAIQHSPISFLSLQHANNETGILFPIRKIADSLRGAKTTIHTDAVQTVGKLSFDVHDLAVDLLSLSGHKLGAPSGIGALYVRKGTPLDPLWEGGAQEKGQRTGTENVLGILALGEACRILRATGDQEQKRIEKLRDHFEQGMVSKIPDIEITGKNLPRIPNTSHILFENVDGESLMIAADLEGISCSMGAACSSGSLKPSHVLLAMGYSPGKARSGIRFSLGWNTRTEDVEYALNTLPNLVAQVRNAGQK